MPNPCANHGLSWCASNCQSRTVSKEEQQMVRGVRSILFAAGLLLIAAVSANAQGMGSIFGKVTDSTGGVMPGVTVTVSGTALQQPLTAVTGATGTYQFPTVPIGTYSVTFELDGFKKAVRNGIIITTGFSA